MKIGIPESSFKPDLPENQSLEDFVKELNAKAVEPGE